jgi:serine/threonine protein kinase/tetratricopeptide (TPR) repeat protein
MAEPPDRTATLERAEAPTADGGHREDRRGLAPGALLSKYTLERVLGEGGMGIVWCARDPDLQRSVAIKLLQCDDASPDARQRLLREARAMARLKHPNVITVYEVDSDGDRDYIAMELVEGASMDAWLTAKPPAEDVWCAIVAAGRGLAAAHAAGLVHRDFKPHNVLRSRDGRVLVTDFGLARGTGEHLARIASTLSNEPVALAQTLEAPHTDRVLDSTLTEPGSLMGTPAYMAPEQFTGSDPDPRTDQFAFCITAWQALTGCRPFTGESLAELRASASAGVAKVQAKLPRAVRAVLVRGLAARPEDRWPDLDALLDALERAHHKPNRRRALIAPIGALAATVILVLSQRHPSPVVAPTNANGCAPPDKAFDAWTAERRAAFGKRLDQQPTALAIADAFDSYRTAWLARYTSACAAAPSPKTAARINCLLGERDDMDGLARLIDTLPRAAVGSLELWGFLPSLAVCDADSPVGPPLLPEDRKQRDAIIRVRAELQALTDPQAMQDRYDAFIERAQKLGWKPLVAEIEVAAATAAEMLDEPALARERFTTAADAAVRLADFQVEATARIGLVEVEVEEMANPRDRTHVDTLIAEAKDAVERAGSDPALATSVELLAAEALLSQGKLDAALAVYDKARAKLIAARALRSASVATEQVLHALRERGETADLERAWQTGLAMERAIAAAGRPVAHSGLGTEMAELAWLRGDLEEAHARADRLEHEAGYDLTITGHVVDAAGKPVAGARVATGAPLAGDASRIFTLSDPRATAVSAADGSFTVIGAAHGAILAELGDQRSPPLASTSGVTLRLGPTHTIHGTVHGDATPWHPTGLVVFARFPTGTAGWRDSPDRAEWRERAVVAADGTFTLANLPAGAAELGLASDHHDVTHEISGGAVRDGATLVWPTGPEVDVIVRAPLADRIVTVKRGNGDVATAHAEPIGLRTATPEGAASYATGDRHVVIDATTRGSTVAVCATKLPCTRVKIGVQPIAVVVH